MMRGGEVFFAQRMQTAGIGYYPCHYIAAIGIN